MTRSTNLTCLIVEDEPLAQEIIAEHIKATPHLTLTATASNAFEASEQLALHRPDMIFLDINLPQLDGLNWLRLYVQEPQNVIITTANPNFALVGFELEVIDYLLKPIRFEKFTKAVAKVTDRLQRRVPTDFFVKDGKKLIRVAFDQVQYIRGMDDYTQIELIQGNIVSPMRMHELESMLPSPPFYRLNRSTIIHANCVKEVNGLQVTLLDGYQFYVSGKYKSLFGQLLENFGRK